MKVYRTITVIIIVILLLWPLVGLTKQEGISISVPTTLTRDASRFEYIDGTRQLFGIIHDSNGLIVEDRFESYYYYSSISDLIYRPNRPIKIVASAETLLPIYSGWEKEPGSRDTPDARNESNLDLHRTFSSIPIPSYKQWHQLVKEDDILIAAFEDDHCAVIVVRSPKGVFLRERTNSTTRTMRLKFYDQNLNTSYHDCIVSSHPSFKTYGITNNQFDPLNSDGVLIGRINRIIAIYNFPRDTIALYDGKSVVSFQLSALIAASNRLHGTFAPLELLTDFTSRGLVIAVRDKTSNTMKLLFIPIQSIAIQSKNIVVMAEFQDTFKNEDACIGTLIYWKGVSYICMDNSILAIQTR
jgi:hypothetical protein